MKPKRKSVTIRPEDPVYAIGVVSRLLHVPEWTLRALEKEGLVRPTRPNKKNRFYSMRDIKRIEMIYFLMEEKGVNMRGVKFIIEQKSHTEF
jgi:MerR family transcriptional regulator/heat shock protein HspR